MYNPFDCEFNDLATENLIKLKSVNEGWYIEYKRGMVSASSIAKSIASFANTYGGYLFYGIKEESKENSHAAEFPGIDRESIDSALQSIRQAAANLVEPSPHFDVKVLWGACDSIGLLENRAIICVRVPFSSNCPHIHKSGLIYRRVADGSEPKPENDRFILDNLWKRGEANREFIRSWIENLPSLLKENDLNSYIRVLLSPDISAKYDVENSLSLKKIRSILNGTNIRVSNTPMDSIYTFGSGFIGRQILQNDPFSMTYTWILYNDLRAEIIIPLKCIKNKNVNIIKNKLMRYSFSEKYINILKKYSFNIYNIIDLNYLIGAMLSVSDNYSKILSENNTINGYYAKFQILNCWKAIPFIDVEGIISEFENHGLPVCIYNNDIIPAGTNPESFFQVSNKTPSDDNKQLIHDHAIIMFWVICAGLGISNLIEDVDRGGNNYRDLLKAASRAEGVSGLEELE